FTVSFSSLNKPLFLQFFFVQFQFTMSTFKPTPDSNTYVPAPASADHAAGTAPAHLAATVRSSRIDPM
ncbi:hypothetical protein HN873_035251, partial [Arachis hypogaea]